MASSNRIDTVYDVQKIAAEQQAVEDLIMKSIEQIKTARAQNIDFNVNTKTFDDYNKKMQALTSTVEKMSKTVLDAAKASTVLAKQKEAEAKAELANTRAKSAANKETERAATVTRKAAQAAKDAERPYKQLALAFKIASERAQDLAAKYGQMDKRAQAAAREANNLNNKLKSIDASIGNHQRNVGNYRDALGGLGDRVKGLGTNFLGLIGVIGTGAFLQSAIDEFIGMDKNVRMLQNTLKNLGVPAAFDRISASADRLAKQFTYLDNDDILKTFQQLTVYGKLTEEQMNDLLPVIIDFAAASGQDLQGATSTIIKALEGNGKALKEYGINIKDAKSTTEALGIVMNELGPKVAGVGKAFGDSAAGGLASAQQEFKNIKEEIGAGLLPILNSVLTVLLDIVKGAFGAGKALVDAFSGESSLIASILGSSDNKDIAFETEQVYKQQLSIYKENLRQFKAAQQQGKLLNKTEDDLSKEFIGSLKKRLAEREEAYKKIKQGVNKQAIMSALADIRGLQRALQELDKTGGTIKPTTDPNKLFGDGKKDKKEKVDNSEFEILRANIELAKEFDLKRMENEKLSYQARLQALYDFGNDSRQLIEAQAENDLKNAELTAGERLKIENNKNNELIRLTQDLADKLEKITQRDFKVDTSSIGKAVKGLPAEIQKALDDFKKAQDQAIKDHAKALEDLKKNTKQAVFDLASELENLFFDIFTNQIEAQKNAIQDQIDLLEAQKQKDIEVENSRVQTAQERADAIAVIEARANAKRQALELKQRQLDQQKARFEKARAVTEIVQGTALAVVNALTQVKSLGPGAIVLASLIGALGAVQIARVLAQPIPRYKDGTENHPGGLAVVGDGGKSETVVLPDGSLYRTPSRDTLVNLPAGSKVIPDYAGNPNKNLVVMDQIDTREDLRNGFNSVVSAIKRIPQPVIRADRAWTQAHRTGSTYRNYLNRSI